MSCRVNPKTYKFQVVNMHMNLPIYGVLKDEQK